MCPLGHKVFNFDDIEYILFFVLTLCLCFWYLSNHYLIQISEEAYVFSIKTLIVLTLTGL